jgi:hypothetical protein
MCLMNASRKPIPEASDAVPGACIHFVVEGEGFVEHKTTGSREPTDAYYESVRRSVEAIRMGSLAFATGCQHNLVYGEGQRFPTR